MSDYITKARVAVAFADTFSDAVYAEEADESLISERAEQLAKALHDLEDAP